MNKNSELLKKTKIPDDEFKSLSVPVFRGSTITYSDFESFSQRASRHRSSYAYGLYGTPTTRNLQSKLTELEGAHDTFLVPSGLMAITMTILAICQTGDLVYLPDNVYPPVRRFADLTLSKLGIVAKYYDPINVQNMFDEKESIKLIWAESPGSTTMEVIDFSVLRTLADKHGAILGCDNSWASPILCKPLELGADIVIEALTKYLSGHSDVLMGAISVKNEELANIIYEQIKVIGSGVSPDDCFLVLRSLETAALRMKHIGDAATSLANELTSYNVISEVLSPTLPSSPFFELWSKQFKGASGLFSIVLKDESDEVFASRFNSLKTFYIGASWGGNHSILAPTILNKERTINKKYIKKKIIRISVGLEDQDDVIDDLRNCLI